MQKKVGVYFCPLNNVRSSDNDIEIWNRIKDSRPLIEAAGFSASDFINAGNGFRVFHCMADSGSPVIAPDGSLYACEHCTEESRLGSIFDRYAGNLPEIDFCRVDRIREKCRRCPFLPRCTGLSSCPLEDTHCREVFTMMLEDMIEKMLQKVIDTSGQDVVC